ncbi:zinc-binding dehydrogenase [Parafrigoribacterium soli]|uniref:zinc-binding dehydrogenase n=1 Tax=Parafrigoribacterium soli TaxID=3144663 RepID=UPI0032EBDE63
MRFVPDAVAIGGRAVVGTIDAVGPDVIGFAPGDRVASLGARADLAEVHLLDSENLIGIPRDVTAEQAAAFLPQGLVARVLVKEAHAVGGRETVLVHAAAGPLGSLVVAWAKSLGATVIATVGSSESRPIASRAGADEVIVFGEDDVEARVRQYTEGRGVDVVYDGVGTATWEASLGSLRRGGELVLCGRAAETQHGSEAAREREVTILRPRLSEHLRGGSIQQGAADLFLAIRSGVFDGVEVAPLVRSPRSVALAA